MLKKAIISFCLVFAGTLFFFSCIKKKNNEDPAPDTEEKVADRNQMLVNWADNIIIPGYASFKLKLDSMKVASEEFVSSPDSIKLNQLRNAWEIAYIEWQKVELFDVGPANDHSMSLYMNIYPADAAGIENNFGNNNANLELPVSFPQQGFPALDYLLNGQGTDMETILKYSSNPDAANRKVYLQRIVNRMVELTNKVNQEWPAYRPKFVSNTSLDAGSPTSILTNNYIMHYEKYVRTGKIGIPSGAMTVPAGAAVFPEKVEAYYKKDLALVLAKTANKAAEDFFNGVGYQTGLKGPSFKTYLDQLGDEGGASAAVLSTTIVSQFGKINNHLNLLSPDLSQQVVSNNAPVLATYNEMQAMVKMLKVDMTSALSITITYTDTDGD